jgi:hypothetical protein
VADPQKRRRIVVMCDYTADPVWTADRQYMLDLDQLPLSDNTKAALRAWAQWYDTLLHRDFEWPAEEERAWTQESRRLWRVVADELGPDYEVGYYDDDGVSWGGTDF